MRLGDLDFPIDARTLEGGAISWTDRAAPARAAAVGCPARATRRLEELEAAAKLQASIAATEGLSGRWCSATSGFVETDGREAFYIVSRLPDGAQPLAELLEQAEEAPGGLSERRRATLAWSLGVGVLRALLDLHERGTHHGELSPEIAMRDRIIVRPRTTDPKDLEVDVALQFPSPRLALLLAGGREPEVGSAEQTDAARLAHILRAILHGRDVLDPDTGVDEMLLSRVFGAQQQAWLRFFEGAAAGAWHADPDFIRSQLALLEPARPVAGGSVQLHDALFRLRRFFAKPAARWGAAAACATLFATVGLVLAWDTLFPPPTWTVERVGGGELKEKGELTIRVQTEGGDPPTVVTATAFKGDVKFAKIDFRLSESREDETLWKGAMPDSDQKYTIVFADKTERTFEVSAEDADPEFKLVRAIGGGFTKLGPREVPRSDDNGLLKLYVQGVDEDSSVIAAPEVKIDGRPVELVPVRSDPRGGSGAEHVWRGTIDLGDLQRADSPHVLEVSIADAKVGSCRLLDVPYTLNLEPKSGFREGQAVKVTVSAKRDREISKQPPDVIVSYDRDELKESGARLTLSDSSAAFALPESSGPYEVTVAVGKVQVRKGVQAADDEPSYKLARLPQPAQSDPNEVLLEITATDRDSPTIEQPILLANGQTLQFDSRDPPLQSTNSAKWTGKVTLPRGDSERTVVLSAGRATLDVQVPATQRIAANNPTPTPAPTAAQPLPPRPITLTVRLLDPETGQEARPIRERGRVRIEPVIENVAEEQRPEAEGALAWELVYAPAPLRSEIEDQLGVVNGSLSRAGELTAPEYNEDYSVELRLRSSDDRRLKVDARSLVIQVAAVDDPPSVDVKLSSAGGDEIRSESLVMLDSTDVTLTIRVTDVDSDPEPPAVQVNGQEFRDLEERPRSGRTVEFVGRIPTQRGDTAITVSGETNDSTTYRVRWEPQDPISAGLTDYGWVGLEGGRWISAQIGFSGGEFKLARDQGDVMTPDRLQELLDSINSKQVGFIARPVALEELKQAMGTPTRSEVVAALIPDNVIRRARRDDPKDQWLRDIFSELEIDIQKFDPNASAPQERRITFCSLSDDSMGIVGLPLARTLKSKPEIEAALDVLLPADREWDPKPWKSGTFSNAYAVIVVEKAVEATADPGSSAPTQSDEPDLTSRTAAP